MKEEIIKALRDLKPLIDRHLYVGCNTRLERNYNLGLNTALQEIDFVIEVMYRQVEHELEQDKNKDVKKAEDVLGDIEYLISESRKHRDQDYEAQIWQIDKVVKNQLHINRRIG